MNLTILRQHYQYEMVTSQVYRTSIISTIKYDNTKETLFFVPVHDVLEDLEIKDSNGKHLTVLSEKELLDRFGIDKKKELDKNKNNALADTLDVIPILLSPSDSMYEKIFFTFTEPIKIDRYEKTKFSLNINIDFRFKIIPSEYIMFDEKYNINKDNFDVHVLFKSGKEYKINKVSDMAVYPEKDQNTIQANQNTDGTVGYFIRDVGFDDVIVGSLQVGLIDTILKSAKIISLVTAIVPIVLFIPILFGKVFVPTLELIGGSMALLIGERFWILKDKYIMRRWVTLQTILLGLNGIIFLVWFTLWTVNT